MTMYVFEITIIDHDPRSISRYFFFHFLFLILEFVVFFFFFFFFLRVHSSDIPRTISSSYLMIYDLWSIYRNFFSLFCFLFFPRRHYCCRRCCFCMHIRLSDISRGYIWYVFNDLWSTICLLEFRFFSLILHFFYFVVDVAVVVVVFIVIACAFI